MTCSRLTTVRDYFLILAGSILYATSTVLFIFPHRVLPGGTSGISVILEAFLSFSPGTILTIINFLLIVGGLLFGLTVFAASAIGLIVKTFGIDFVIGQIKKYKTSQKA